MRGTVTVQAANLPPLVAITTPTNGATFTPPALLTITANASDSDGTIRQVEFFAGALSIGVVTNAPYIYSIPAAAVPPGPYVLTARATDNLGLVATSAPVNVTVVAPNSPPTVSFTSPAEGAVFTPPMLFSMTARASDSDGSVRQVEFFASGIPLGVVTNSPYTYAAPAAVIPPGNYVLTARATDNQGATTTSAAVNVRVRPALAIGSASFAAPGQFRLNLTGAAGLAYVLETSSNLTSWLPVATNTASADDFTLTDAPGPGPRRFYRVRQLP